MEKRLYQRVSSEVVIHVAVAATGYIRDEIAVGSVFIVYKLFFSPLINLSASC